MSLWFLDADMDCGPLDLGDGGRNLENFSVRNFAVSLKNHFASVLLDAIGHGLACLFEGDRGSLAVPQQQLRFGSWGRGPEEGQESGCRLLNANPMPGGRNVNLLTASHLNGKEHESHELKNDIDHGCHVDVLVTFLGGFTAEQHFDQPATKRAWANS
jgi:hypothetical protein